MLLPVGLAVRLFIGWEGVDLCSTRNKSCGQQPPCGAQSLHHQPRGDLGYDVLVTSLWVAVPSLSRLGWVPGGHLARYAMLFGGCHHGQIGLPSPLVS
jgi:hypothetical protein